MATVTWEGQRLQELGAPDLLVKGLPCTSTLVACLEEPGGPFGELIAFFDEVDSTNDLALESGAKVGTVFVAESQRKGRGRGNRSWESPPAVGLYLSVVAPVETAEAWGGLLMQSIAVSVVEAIRGLTSLEAAVKWPNDVLIGNRKVSGVMAQIAAGRVERMCVVGIGVNANQSMEQLPADVDATSLSLELGESVQKGLLLAEILRSLNWIYGMLTRNERSRTVELCNEHSASVGAKIVAEFGDRESVVGVGAMIGERGELIIETDDGEQHSIMDPAAVLEQRIGS